jgi:ABC-2 type transport system permease protein
MTANAATVTTPRNDGLFLGFRTAFGKELIEWLHGPKVPIVAVLSSVIAILTTLATRMELGAADAGDIIDASRDPTFNALIGLTAQGVGLFAIIATMTLISVERDRGTLGWSLTNPVSPTSILAAKYVASMIVFSLAAVVLPMIASVVAATVAYGTLPDLATVAVYTLLFLAVPAFFLAMTIGLGTGIRSTAGIAAIALAVLFLPQLLGGFVPHLNEFSPTSIGRWAQAVVVGDPAPMSVPIAWAISMVAIVVGAKVVFDRQEF